MPSYALTLCPLCRTFHTMLADEHGDHPSQCGFGFLAKRDQEDIRKKNNPSGEAPRPVPAEAEWVPAVRDTVRVKYGSRKGRVGYIVNPEQNSKTERLNVVRFPGEGAFYFLSAELELVTRSDDE